MTLDSNGYNFLPDDWDPTRYFIDPSLLCKCGDAQVLYLVAPAIRENAAIVTVEGQVRMDISRDEYDDADGESHLRCSQCGQTFPLTLKEDQR